MSVLKKLFTEKTLGLLIDALIMLLAKQLEEQFGLSPIITTLLLKFMRTLFEEISLTKKLNKKV